MDNFGISDALKVTAVSMLLVFILLAFLMVVIYLQSYLIKTFSNMKESKIKNKTEPVKLDEVDITEEAVEQVSEDDEIEVVAAIMAALSTYMDVPQEKLAIKSIKRLNANNSSWGSKSL